MRIYILSLFILVFVIFNCTAQEITITKNRLTKSVTEHFTVLKNEKKTVQGPYQALYKNKTVIANGNYTDSVKTGIWHFFDTNGKVVQIYDYGKSRLLYEEPIDKTNINFIQYQFDQKFQDSDKITKPIKVGGRTFGYIPYLKVYQLPHDVLTEMNARIAAGYYVSAAVIMEVLVSPGGRLADLKIHFTSNIFSQNVSFSPELFTDDDRFFFPATVNGEPIMLRIFLLCRVNNDGMLDVD